MYENIHFMCLFDDSHKEPFIEAMREENTIVFKYTKNPTLINSMKNRINFKEPNKIVGVMICFYYEINEHLC